GDRGRALRQRGDRQDARQQRALEAPVAGPGAGRGLCIRERLDPTRRTGTSVKAPPPRADSGEMDGMLLLVGLVILVVVGGGLVLVRRYAHPDARASDRQPVTTADLKLDELIGASRRLKSLGSDTELPRAIVHEAVGLVGARTGALILRRDDGLVV